MLEETLRWLPKSFHREVSIFFQTVCDWRPCQKYLCPWKNLSFVGKRNEYGCAMRLKKQLPFYRITYVEIACRIWLSCILGNWNNGAVFILLNSRSTRALKCISMAFHWVLQSGITRWFIANVFGFLRFFFDPESQLHERKQCYDAWSALGFMNSCRIFFGSRNNDKLPSVVKF